MIITFDGTLTSKNKEGNVIFLTSKEAKKLAAYLETAADEADDHDAYTLVLMSETQPIDYTFHIRGKNVPKHS